MEDWVLLKGAYSLVGKIIVRNCLVVVKGLVLGLILKVIEELRKER